MQNRQQIMVPKDKEEAGQGKQSITNFVEPLSGSLLRQWVRCGKPSCRCARGDLHGPYWYRYWRDEEGRAHKHYVAPSRLDEIEAGIAERRRGYTAFNTVLERVRSLAKVLATVDDRGPAYWQDELERRLAALMKVEVLNERSR